MKVSRIPSRYKLLKPTRTSPGNNITLYTRALTPQQLEKYILTPASGDLVAVDLETRGVTPFYPHVYKTQSFRPQIMGVGFAYPHKGGYKAAYVDLRKQPDETIAYMIKRMSELALVGHNTMFDNLWLRELGLRLGVKERLNWVVDTYGLFKQFAGQDFLFQKHGLKDAQVSLLGWDEKGDIELDEWLINAGYYTESGKKGERVKRAVKGEMWRAPTDILGKYCALDCIGTLQLFDKIFEPLMHRFPMMWNYHEGPFLRTVQELTDQQINGVVINTDKLDSVGDEARSLIAEAEAEFFALEEIKPYLEEWRELQIAKLNEPAKFKKDGDLSKNWIKYDEKVQAMRADPRYCFNPGSDKQLQWLFYEKLYKNEAKTIEYNRREIQCYEVESPRGSILLPATEAGQPPIDKKALPWLGKAGEILLRRAKQDTTVSTFVTPYLEYSRTSYSGRMHPGWKVPQAVTGRLGGSKPNFQQITGDKRVLECVEADPGYVIVERDWTALEDYVAANITQCPGLLALYGPDAKDNDGHLWLGSQLPVIGEAIRATGYDKDNPTPEAIKRAKAECKKERDISKAVKYSATYGIGAFKLWQDLMSQGVDIELDAVAKVLYSYWDVFIGMKNYKHKLKDEWDRNQGYILNASGRPMTVGDHHLKDLFSRCVQGGGHDLQMMFGENVANAVKEQGLDAKPFIYDLHDATYWQVKEEQLEKYIELSTQAAEQVWQWCKSELGWNCRLKVSVAYGKNLKQLKEG